MTMNNINPLSLRPSRTPHPSKNPHTLADSFPPFAPSPPFKNPYPLPPAMGSHSGSSPAFQSVNGA